MPYERLCVSLRQHALHRTCVVQMGTVTKIPGNKPDIATNNPVADNAGGTAKPEEAKPNA